MMFCCQLMSIFSQYYQPGNRVAGLDFYAVLPASSPLPKRGAGYENILRFCLLSRIVTVCDLVSAQPSAAAVVTKCLQNKQIAPN